MRFEAPVS